MSELNSLREHRGYKRLISIAKEQCDSRFRDIILKPLTSLDDVPHQEYSKGEISGIQLFMHFTDAEIDDLAETIQQKLKEEEIANADSNSVPSAGA